MKIKNSGTIIIICILAFITSVILSFGKCKESYEWKDNIGVTDTDTCVNLLGMDVILDEQNVRFNKESGEYLPTGDDPWIMYSEINDSYKGALIKCADASLQPMEIKIYWTCMGEDALSENHTRTVYMDKGEKSAYIKLPNYPINYLRFDIADKCTIESISLGKGKIKTEYHLGLDFVLAVIIRFIIIVPVLYIAYLAHKDRIRKGSGPIKGLFVDEIKNPAGHKNEYDYIRTLAAVLVIMMHSVIENFAPSVTRGMPGYLILKLVLAVSLVCNALYIMLSGALLLQPKEESIGEFYKKRLGKVLIPTFSYYLLYMIQGYGSKVFEDGIGSGILCILKGLFTSRPEYMLHMWFIYAILSLYIFAPFLRIIVRNISDNQLFGLVVAGFIFDIFGTVLPMNGIAFGIDTPIAGWMGVFLLGYYMTTEHARRKYKIFMVLGVLALCITCALVYFKPDLLYYESNWAPLMWLEGAGVFAFFGYFKKLFGKRSLIIASISKYNFSIMLVHVLLLMKFILPIGWGMEAEYGHLRIFIVGIILVTLVLSYVVSVIYDNTAIIAANYVYNKWAKNKKRG